MSCLCMLYCKMPSRGCSSHYCWWQAWCDVLSIAWNASYNSRLDTFALWVHMARLELPQIIACMLHKCMSTQLQATTHWLVLLKDTHAWDSNLHVSASWCAHWREGNWAPIQVSNISGLQRHVRWCTIQLCDCCVVFKAAANGRRSTDLSFKLSLTQEVNWLLASILKTEPGGLPWSSRVEDCNMYSSTVVLGYAMHCGACLHCPWAKPPLYIVLNKWK